MQAGRQGRRGRGRGRVYARMGRENKMHWDNWQPRRVSDEGRKNGEGKRREKGKRVALTSELQIATRDAPSSHPLLLLPPSWHFCTSKVGFVKLELSSMRRSPVNLTNRQTFNLYRICALHRIKRSLLLRPAHKCTSLRDLSFGDDTHSWIMILENAGGGR